MAVTRIFLVNTCLSTVYAAICANENPHAEGTDILMIDSLRLRPSERKLIQDARGLHAFDRLIDCSLDIAEVDSYAPGRGKRLIRKYKEKRLIKPIYSFLFAVNEKRKAKKERQKLIALLDMPREKGDALQLFLQPNQFLTPRFKEAYPQAEVFHIEHGLGDYYDVQRLGDKEVLFLCVFAERFGAYMLRNQRSDVKTRPIFSAEGFKNSTAEFRRVFPQLGKMEQNLPQQDKLVLIILQPLEQQQIPLQFWDYFLDESIGQLADKEGRLFLVKPHPKQAAEVTAHVMHYLEKKELPALVWDEPEVRALSIEIIFACLQDKIEAVLSPFSSSIFYLPQLFPHSQTQFFYSIRYVLKFADQTPDMFKNRWIASLPIFEEVFATQSKELKAK